MGAGRKMGEYRNVDFRRLDVLIAGLMPCNAHPGAHHDVSMLIVNFPLHGYLASSQFIHRSPIIYILVGIRTTPQK